MRSQTVTFIWESYVAERLCKHVLNQLSDSYSKRRHEVSVNGCVVSSCEIILVVFSWHNRHLS